MLVLLMVVLVALLLNVAVLRFGADTRDGRDWRADAQNRPACTDC
jgi:hypothetical protein